MPTLQQWGPSTWTFFHALASKMKTNSFPIIGAQLLQIIVQISSNLPCPECTRHAKSFFSTINPKTITSQEHLKRLIHNFHNSVNKRTERELFPFENLDKKYKNLHMIHVYNNFVKNYHTKGNMQMLTDSFHRERLVAKIRLWIKQNLQHFDVEPEPVVFTPAIIKKNNYLDLTTNTIVDMNEIIEKKVKERVDAILADLNKQHQFATISPPDTRHEPAIESDKEPALELEASKVLETDADVSAPLMEGASAHPEA